MHSGFPTERLEQTVSMSLYDITRVFHATEGGNYKKENTTEPLGLLLLLYCHLGVLAQVFGSLTRHRPSTSAISVPLE